MSFSQEVSLKISLDTSKAASDAQKLVAVMQQAGQKADAAFSGLNGTKKVTEAINQEMFKQLSTTDKIKSVATQITELSKTKQAYEQGSKAYLEAQLAILQKQSQLQSLIRKEAKESAAQSGGGGAVRGGEGAAEVGTSVASLVGGGMFKRLLFMGAGAIMTSLIQAVPSYFQRKATEAVAEEKTGEAQLASTEQTAISKYGLTVEATIAKRRARDAIEFVKTAKKDIADLEGTSFLGKAYHQTAMLISSGYASTYAELKQRVEDAKVKETEYGNASQLTQRALVKENATLAIKAESLQNISKLQESSQLNAVAVAEQKLIDARKERNRIALPQKNSAEIRQSELAIKQAEIEVVAAKRANAIETANLETNKNSLTSIQKIQSQRKVDIIDIAQIEQDAATKELQDIKNNGGTRLQILSAENNLRQKQIALQAAQNTTEAEFLNVGSKEQGIIRINHLQETGGANAISLAKVQLDIAKEAVEVAKMYGTELEQASARANEIQAEGSYRAAQINMQQRQIDVSQSISEQAAGAGRTFANGRARPLSETERLARQAMQARLQARNAVLTGAPGEAAMQQQRALGLEASVSDRLSFGSSEMQRRITPDSSGIAAEITTSNQLLEAIKNSLTPTVN
jgi:hypothetical protein